MITLVLTRVVKTVDESMKSGMQQQTYKPAASNQKSERSLKQVLGSQSASVAFVNHFFWQAICRHDKAPVVIIVAGHKMNPN